MAFALVDQPGAPLRQRRKLDHIRLAVAGRSAADYFQDVTLIHRATPELDWSDLDLSQDLAGVPLPVPVYLNAITGGSPGVQPVNAALAALAARHGLPMAVGSQKAALDDPTLCETYRAARREHPHGVLIANLSATATPAQVETAVDMLGADLIQIHVNAAQELIMPEGDRTFRHWLDSISRLVRTAPVPVIVKEVGFGMAGESIAQLYAAGVRCVDVSGQGGTNFASIEGARRGRPLDPGLAQWGHPTPYCLAEAMALGLPDLAVLASGGISYGSQAAKCLAMGARAVGIAGSLLKVLVSQGPEAADEWLGGFLSDLTVAVLLTGSRTLADLRRQPVIITGRMAEWLTRRGIDPGRFSRQHLTIA